MLPLHFVALDFLPLHFVALDLVPLNFVPFDLLAHLASSSFELSSLSIAGFGDRIFSQHHSRSHWISVHIGFVFTLDECSSAQTHWIDYGRPDIDLPHIEAHIEDGRIAASKSHLIAQTMSCSDIIILR